MENKIESVSATKLQVLPSTPATQVKVSKETSYVLMNNDMWRSLLCDIKCDECCEPSLDVIAKGAFVFSTKIEMICKNCNKIFCSIFSSPQETETKCFESNKRFVEAFLKIGKRHTALEIFSMAVGIHAMDKKTFSKCVHTLFEEKKILKNEILEISRTIIRKRHEEIDEPKAEDEIIDITVSYDGTWQKRGHTSLNGIGLVVDVLTGLVVDFKVLSKYWPECTAAKKDLDGNSAEFFLWHEGHKAECSENYSGSSNAMEMKAAEILWRRSISDCRMRYTNNLSDGDAKTFQHLSSLNVYGNTKITRSSVKRVA